jgi:flagellar biosynthesis activator protein FlaF
MLNMQFQAQLRRPANAAAAYGTIIRETESSRDIEYRVFERVTAALEAACAPDAHFTQKIKAAHDNRLLWQTLAADLADDGNALPATLRAHLLGLAIWVGRETERVPGSGAALRNMADINHTIMQGLRPPGRQSDAAQA